MNQPTEQLGTTNARDADVALMQMIAQGNEKAMENLYRKHQSAVFAFAMSRIGDRSQAWDVVHDVMVDVWRKAGSYSGKASVRTWVLTLTRNKAIDRLRRGVRMDYGDDGLDLVSDAPSQEDDLLAEEQAKQVRACMDQLPPKRRGVLHLAFFEDRTYPEIAKIEGIAVGTVKSHVHDAKKALASCLKALLDVVTG
ncbi:MAG: RNA polymerase sigma factor [Parvularculaceae bacterium]|nr:RNA polymerase sigma factor [Parvularculaceae bacterium]